MSSLRIHLKGQDGSRRLVLPEAINGPLSFGWGSLIPFKASDFYEVHYGMGSWASRKIPQAMTTVCGKMTQVGNWGNGEVLVVKLMLPCMSTLIASLVSSPAARHNTPHFNIRSHLMMDVLFMARPFLAPDGSTSHVFQALY